MGTDGYQMNCINTAVMITGMAGDRDCKHPSQALILQPIAKTKMRQKARDLCQVSTLLDATSSARLQQDSPGALWKWTSGGRGINSALAVCSVLSVYVAGQYFLSKTATRLCKGNSRMEMDFWRERCQLSTCCMHCVECLCCCIIPSHARLIRQRAKQRRQTARQRLVTCAMNPLWMATNQNTTSNWVTAAYLSSPGWSGWVYFEL